MNAPRIIPIAITGGPCSGKTSAMAYLIEEIGNRGARAVCSSEVATDFICGGFFPGNGMSNLDFQLHLTRHMIEREERWLEAARTLKHELVVVFFDRGLMDTRAYASEEEFQEIMRRTGLSIVQMRDTRYDAVFHLRSVAVGAPELYTCENNPARREGRVEEARELDERTLRAWYGAPHLRIIDNSTNFEGKLRRLLAGVCGVIGIPEPLETERKFLVKGVPGLNPEDIHYEEIDIEQHYLFSQDGISRRIRSRGQDGYFAYFYTEKEPVRTGTRIERERLINEREFMMLLSMRDPRYLPIKKKRLCFVWENRYFELDLFEDHNEGLALLEVELESMDEDVLLPPFIEIEREVTDDREYSNQELARAQ